MVSSYSVRWDGLIGATDKNTEAVFSAAFFFLPHSRQVSLCTSACDTAGTFFGVATPRLYCPPSLLPPSCLILPQDQPPSPCLPWWLLSSSASCPGWHELMITAEASQSRLIHYIFLAGLQQVLHCFWHLMHGTLPRLSTANTSNPPSHPPLFAAFHNMRHSRCAAICQDSVFNRNLCSSSFFFPLHHSNCRASP